MNRNINQTAEELVHAIRTDPLESSRVLVDFTKTYSGNKQLIIASIILRNNYLTAKSKPEKEDIIIKMLDLVARIVTNDPGSENTDNKLINDCTDSKFQKKNDVVFTGKAISKTYKKSNFTLSEIDLTLRLGEITGVVGKNANGKTTLFEIVSGNLSVDEGEVKYSLFSDVDKADKYSLKNKISYIPQQLTRWHGSLKENLHYEAALCNYKGNANEDKIRWLLHRLDLTEYSNLNWNELSGGYKLRFQLAKIIIRQPAILILDEPLAYLDVKAQIDFLNDVRDLSKSLKNPFAVLISSQNLYEIESISDNIIFLSNGKTVYYGKTKGIGDNRTENIYEFESEIAQNILEKKLSGFNYITLNHTGFSYIINTTVNITQKEILKFFLDNNIEITYFRDISQSSKRMFL